jgi:hypothetical protein
MRTSWPAAGPALAIFKFLFCPANSPFPRHLLFGVFNPADELIASQRRDIHPGIKRRRAGNQRLAQVSGKLMYDPTGHSRTHRVTVSGQGEHRHHFTTGLNAMVPAV